MKNLIRKLLGVFTLVAFIGINAFAQSSFTFDSDRDQNVGGSFCAGTVFTFNVNVDPANAGDAASFEWNFGDGTVETVSTSVATHVYTVGGVYSASVKITYGGAPVEAVPARTVTVHKRPNATVSMGTIVGACAGETVNLAVEAYGNAVWWSNAKTTEQITVTGPGKYKVTIYDPVTYCLAFDDTDPRGTVEVVFFNNPIIDEFNLTDLEYNLTEDKNAQGLEINLFQLSGNDNDITYTWTPAESVRPATNTQFFVTPMKTTTYNIQSAQKHTLSYGDKICYAEKQVTVDVVVIRGNESTPFTANNVFMPGTVYNNEWKMNGDNELVWYENCKLTIFNSWGQEVYVADKIGNLPGFPNYIWDGKTNDGEELPADTYYYLVQCSDCNCEPSPQKNEHKGTVSIMRK